MPGHMLGQRRRNLQTKRRTLPSATLDVNVSAEQIDVLLYHVKSETYAAALHLRIGALDLTESFEYRGDLFLRNPYAGVGNGKMQHFFRRHVLRRNGNRAVIGELDGVIDQVFQYPFELASVTLDSGKSSG